MNTFSFVKVVMQPAFKVNFYFCTWQSLHPKIKFMKCNSSLYCKYAVYLNVLYSTSNQLQYSTVFIIYLVLKFTKSLPSYCCPSFKLPSSSLPFPLFFSPFSLRIGYFYIYCTYILRRTTVYPPFYFNQINKSSKCNHNSKLGEVFRDFFCSLTAFSLPFIICTVQYIQI